MKINAEDVYLEDSNGQKRSVEAILWEILTLLQQVCEDIYEDDQEVTKH